MTQSQECGVAEHEAHTTCGPDPFAPDPIRQVPECDLPGNRDEAHEPKCPGRRRRSEPDLDEVLRLVHLHGVPGDHAAEVSRGDPPETARLHGVPERPVPGGPYRVDDIRLPGGGSAALRHLIAVRLETEVMRPAPQKKV